MTDITVRHDPASGGALIEIRGVDTGETRFRLRDPYTEKFLTRRGWSKNAAFLPGEAVRDGDLLTIAISADLARKVSPGIKLVLEQPTAEMQEIVAWPEHIFEGPAGAVAAPAAISLLPDERAVPDDGAMPDETPTVAERHEDAVESDAEDQPIEANPDAAPVSDTLSDHALAEAADADLKADLAREEAANNQPADGPMTASGTTGPDIDRDPPPLLIDSFEPSIMDDRLHDEDKREQNSTAEAPPPADRRDFGFWRPAAIAAAICLLIGTGLGYVLAGPGESASATQSQDAAAIQLEKQQWEFDRRLKEAQAQASTAAGDQTKATQAQVTALEAERDKAQQALADKDKSIAALQQQLSDAQAQIEAVKNATGDQAQAQIAVLDAKIGTLSASLMKANGDIEDRSRQLQESQAKLTTLGDQLASRDRDLKSLQARLDAATAEIASIRETAKADQASNTGPLQEQVKALTAEAEASRKTIGERDAALRDVQAKLSVANIQIEALKVVANKSAQAGLEKNAISERLGQLTAELDKTSQALSDREQKLAETATRLKDAESRLATAETEKQALAALQQQQQGRNPEPGQSNAREPVAGEDPARMKEERDIYAEELRSMTASFTALQKEKAALEKTVAELKTQSGSTEPGATLTGSKAIWGATAIDQSGAIYSLQNQVSEKIAKDNVAAMCRGKSGSSCEPLTSYSNACFSVARFEGEQPSADNYAYFVNRDWKTASATARERCESMGGTCSVRFTACSPDALSKPASE